MGQSFKGMPSAEQRMPVELARLPRRPALKSAKGAGSGSSVSGYMWDCRKVVSVATSFGTGQVVIPVAEMDILVLKAMQELGVHPNLLAVLDLFVPKGSTQVSLVTQLCCGGHLADAMALRHFASPALRRLSPGVEVSLALAWISQLFSALAFLHEGRIIHRCIQPESCILDNTRIVESNMVLGNFSQSSRLHLDNIMIDRPEGPLPGSASYMAPELKRQAMSSTGRPIEIKSDCWSLGCVFYLMLEGKPAFNYSEFPSRAQKGEYLLPRSPNDVQDFIATLLQVDYVRRADAQSALADAQRLCRRYPRSSDVDADPCAVDLT